MRLSKNNVIIQLYSFSFKLSTFQRCYHRIPFLDLYQKTTGQTVSNIFCQKLQKKYPQIELLCHDRLQCTLQILEKYGITAVEAFKSENMHVFLKKPITMDNYASVLYECGFIKVEPKHIVRYHTYVRERTIKNLKNQGLLKEDLNMEKHILDQIKDWPDSKKTLENFKDSSSCILQIRLNILEKYLHWRLMVTPEDFNKYCINYLPIKHKPMSDIQQALDIAQHVIKFDNKKIRRNGCIISADPLHTKLILNNVETIADLDIRDAVKIEPSILKNDYKSILEIKSILEEYRIPPEAQRKCIKVFCMCPKTVRTRLDELKNLKEYQILMSNPRIVSLVVYQKKIVERLKKIDSAKKQCFSLNILVASNRVFNNFILGFGSKLCPRDLGILIATSFHMDTSNVDVIMSEIKRHKYYIHTALGGIDENIKYLKNVFDDSVILKNSHLLLYPLYDIKQCIEYLLNLRNEENAKINSSLLHKPLYNNLRFSLLSDSQILSLALYEIEKKYHFSGDGLWNREDMAKIESNS